MAFRRRRSFRRKRSFKKRRGTGSLRKRIGYRM